MSEAEFGIQMGTGVSDRAAAMQRIQDLERKLAIAREVIERVSETAHSYWKEQAQQALKRIDGGKGG